MRTKPYIVGICGGSASGKTYLLHRLLHLLPSDEVCLVSQDNYYKKFEDQIKDEDGLVNFDHPDSIDLGTYARDVQRLLAGETITLPEYTFNNPEVQPRMLTFHPAPLIIVEGLFIYYHAELRCLIDLRIFVDADEHVRLTRRLRRDHSERGYSFDSILRDYSKFVAPMYEEYVAPMKKDCDIIIPNNRHMDNAIGVLATYLRDKLTNCSPNAS